MERNGSNARMDPDNWHGVADPKKRKQIQDRLAQRARRRRLKEAAEPHSESSDMSVDNTSKFLMNTTMARDHELMPRPSISIWEALYVNGKLMGLSCSTVLPCKSSPAAPNIPPSLRPTVTQIFTVHFSWIDRWPFPQMRDNMINLGGIIDDEEFIHDVFTMPTFKIKPGHVAWDPTGWVAEKEWMDKWGYLLYSFASC